MARNSKTIKLIDKILSRGFAKYEIKQYCGVSWQCVHYWSLGVSNPEGDNAVRVEEMTRLDIGVIKTQILFKKGLAAKARKDAKV